MHALEKLYDVSWKVGIHPERTQGIQIMVRDTSSSAFTMNFRQSHTDTYHNVFSAPEVIDLVINVVGSFNYIPF